MAKSKTPQVKDLNGYLFMGIRGTHVELVYHDDTDNGLAIGAAFSSVLEEDEKLFDIFSVAMLTALETKAKKETIASLKGKYNSKKSNIVPKKVVKKTK